ncbi:MAG TPA: hypothetical protein VML75_09705 [Kofleriaceae bacterium]|nr:hypothetical protein [Kofleriaceae bacterium]
MARDARRLLSGLATALALAVLAAPAHAYEFEMRVRTVGQGAELASFRRLSANLLLGRTRFTSSVSLEIWDLNGRLARRKLYEPPRPGPRLFVSTHLRIDHDFGEWTTGSYDAGGQRFDAVDLIPELEQQSLNLDLLWGYFAAEGLWDGRIDVHAGRLLEVADLGWWNVDGARVKLRAPWFFAVEAVGGLRVRDSSPLGSSVHELDGTASGGCEEYIERGTPGEGTWEPISRDVMGDPNPFSSDFDLCPQREELMPTWGVALESSGLGSAWARVSYRRTISRTPGLIGPVDRNEFPDLGLYPNEAGQVPPWGINEEQIAASVRYNQAFARGKGQVTPYLAGKYSLLVASLEEARAGARLRYAAHSLEPEVFYSLPVFDGDSIFNVFSVQPYTDFRLTYDVSPAGEAWGGYVRGWSRIYQTEDEGNHLAMDVVIDPLASAAGGQVGVRYVPRRDLLARLDVFHEDGYGGRRTGGYGSARWQVRKTLGLAGRVSVIDFAEDSLPDLNGTTVGAQLGATYVINVEGVAVHLLLEDNTNRFYDRQFRAIGVLDLAFHPET